MPDRHTPDPTPHPALLVSRDHYLGIAVTGPGLDLPARHLAAKAGFVPHTEQDAMVLPSGHGPGEAEQRAARAVALLYYAGYAITLDTTLPRVRPPSALPDLGPATMAIHDATATLRVMPHPVDAAALLDKVRTGPLARLGALLDTAVPRADVIDHPESARDARHFLHDAAEHLAAAETAVRNAAAVLRANAPAPARTPVAPARRPTPPTHPTPPTRLGPRQR